MTVLSYTQIKASFNSIFVANGKVGNIDAAKYYLTLGEQFLILPSGDKYFAAKPRRGRFVIEPGQTAFVSTAERLIMPPNLIGILGPRFDNTGHGVLFFGGMLVDPGYGMHGRGEASDTPGQPLSFNIANVSSMPLELRPGEDKIASIAFLEIGNPLDERELRENFLKTKATEARVDLFTDGKSRQPTKALGLVEDLSQIRSEVDKLEASVSQVVLFGVVVLAVTLFAGIMTVIFDLTGQLDISKTASATEPIWKTVGFTLGFIVLAILLVVGAFYATIYPFSKAIGLKRRMRLND